MDLAPLFLAFRFSGGREREGSAPSARIVCQPKWLSLYQSPGIVCHCWRRQRKPWLLGFFRKFADACEVRKQPLPTHAMNKSRLRFCLCVYVCVRVRDRSNYRIPLRIGWSRIRNEIKQRGIYRSRRGINTILMRIRQLGGSILSRLSNLDLKNPDLFVIAGKKEGGRWISRELSRWYSLIGIQFHSSFFSVFRSSVTRRGGGGEFIFPEWRKNGCKIRWSFSIISWIVEITGRGVGEGRLLFFFFFNSTGKLVPRSPPVLCCRLSLLVAKPRPRI